ncbi:MAG: hypothetical protein E6J45_13700 [Chloroflexi bacterium]|nr:MAG: hypothetical protein E6J45_13700 [Chloroflexota bacterium]
MRPNPDEVLAGIQAALAETLVPELTTAYAQEVAGTVQMLLQSLAAEWDTAADDLRRDNQRLRDLLGQGATVLSQSDAGNENIASLVKDIESALARPPSEDLRVSALRAENEELRRFVERMAVLIEDLLADGPSKAGAEVSELRAAVYGHLRDVAARGWSFWDLAGFREYMSRLRAEQSGDAG